MRTNLMIIIFLIIQSLFTCTIIYTAAGETPLGGGNEDYNDPYTYMTVYPSEQHKLGWIKFSFGSGFPQAGMNESGLFWDGASAPYLDMPESVANKEILDGPIMQKIIEECSNCEEAQDVFAQYYCTDQFNAQYLIGDAEGVSMIVEGDKIVVNEGSYQVLTNFNVNHPELGGYPCWRYETAMEMFSEGEHDIYQLGFILSATHQEGNYPTLYSNIYDLAAGQIYIFDQHNFNEYMVVDLLEEIGSGYAQYPISAQFSGIEDRFPEYDAVITSSTIDISWKGWLNSTYELQYSYDHGFAEFRSITLQGSKAESLDKVLLFPIIGSFLLLGSGVWKKRRTWIILLVIFIVLSILSGCSQDETETKRYGVHRITLSSLENGQTCYWRVLSEREGSSFSTETTVFPFSIDLE